MTANRDNCKRLRKYLRKKNTGINVHTYSVIVNRQQKETDSKEHRKKHRIKYV